MEECHRKKKGGGGLVSSGVLDPYDPTRTWEGPKFGPSVSFFFLLMCIMLKIDMFLLLMFIMSMFSMLLLLMFIMFMFGIFFYQLCQRLMCFAIIVYYVHV